MKEKEELERQKEINIICFKKLKKSISEYNRIYSSLYDICNSKGRNRNLFIKNAKDNLL